MTGALDSLQIAYTKIRMRKLRLVVTVSLSGLIFSAIIAALLLSAGAFKSVNAFSKSGLGSRYIVSVAIPPNSPYDGGMFNNNATVATQADAIENSIIAAKKAAASRLGISYDPTTETPPVQTIGNISSNQDIINLSTTAGDQAASQYLAAHPAPGMQTVQKLAAPYHAIAYYQSQPVTNTLTSTVGESNSSIIEALIDGKEPLLDTSDNSGYSQTGISSFGSLLTDMSDPLLQPFLLPGQTLKTGSNGSIPIVIPYSAAQQFLNLAALSSNASATQQLSRLRQVRSEINGYTFPVCYRNGASASLVNEALDQQATIQQNQGSTSYQKPDLVYAVPTQACGAVSVARDVRTAAEKQSDALQNEFDALFGTTSPTQSLITFRVVGVVPDLQQGNATQVNQILNTLFQSNLGSGWFLPDSQLTSSSVLSQFFPSPAQNPTAPSHSYYVAFPNTTDEQNFIAAQTCTSNNANTCITRGQPFTVTPFGSNSVALSHLRANFDHIVEIAMAAAAGLAIVFMSGTVGRIIADSRRETAIFRAIGAKRIDIIAIYITYSVLLSMLIVAFSVVLGAAVALVLSGHYSASFTTKALIAYEPQDLNQSITLFGANFKSVAVVAICILIVGILSSLLPLVRNSRRNPIRDMRDE
jgi:hypothetical protein